MLASVSIEQAQKCRKIKDQESKNHDPCATFQMVAAAIIRRAVNIGHL
jgi:hypothetical protein